jgi:hypothetical protein
MESNIDLIDSILCANIPQSESDRVKAMVVGSRGTGVGEPNYRRVGSMLCDHGYLTVHSAETVSRGHSEQQLNGLVIGKPQFNRLKLMTQRERSG